MVLGLATEYNTSSMIRSKAIINALSRLGHTVICFSPRPNIASIYYDYPSGIDEAVYIIRYGQKTWSSEIGLNKYSGIKRYLYKIYKKYDLFGSSIYLLKYRYEIRRKVLQINPDIIISFSDPKISHILANFCSKKLDSKNIQQWGDPLAYDIASVSKLPFFMKKVIEKMIMKNASTIVYVSPITLSVQKSIFKELAGKMFFVPTPCIRVEANSNCANKILKIGYFGSYNSNVRNIQPLCDAIKQFGEKVELFLVGDSDVIVSDCDNISCKDRVSPDELKKYIDSVDVLICLMNIRGTQIPGKIYHYAGTIKEVLILKDGEYKDEIEEYFCIYNRYSFAENNKNAIVDRIFHYLEDGIPRREPVEAFMAESVANNMISRVRNPQAEPVVR